VSYLRYSEEILYKGSKGAAQFVTALLFAAVNLIALSYAVPIYFTLLSTPMLFFIITNYCLSTPTEVHQITESIAISNWCMPFVEVLIVAALSVPANHSIAGIIIGYAYHELNKRHHLVIPGLEIICGKLGLGEVPPSIWLQQTAGHKLSND